MTEKTNHMNNFDILKYYFSIIVHISISMTGDKDENTFDYLNNHQDIQTNSALLMLRVLIKAVFLVDIQELTYSMPVFGLM